MARGLTTGPTPACRDLPAARMLRVMARKPRQSTRPLDPRAMGTQPASRSFWDERWALALAAIFLLTLAWRLSALARLADSPLMGALNSDSQVYWAWAGEIRAGAWVGRQAFFLGPLYPYWLALVRALFGDSLRVALTVQCVLGAGAVTLLTDAARRIVAAPIALVVGALLGMLAMGTFFDVLVLMESLVFSLTALILWMVLRWDWPRRASLGALIVGVAIGLSAQGRATHVLLLAPFVGFAFASLDRASAMRAALVAIATVVLLALPTTIRHRVLVGEWIPYTYSLGFNAFVGNGPVANGSFLLTTGSVESEDLVPGSAEGGAGGDGRAYQRRIEGVVLTPGQSSRRWLQQTIAFVRREPATTLRRYLDKLALLINRRELAQIENIDVTERVVGRLGPPGLGSFLPLGLLGMVGLVLAMRRTARERYVAGVLLTLALSTAVFFVTDRYRFQLMPAFALLAAVALQALVTAATQRDGRMLGGIALGLALAAALAALPRVPFDLDHLAWETDSSVGAAYLSRGEIAPAVEALQRAVALDRAGRLRNGDWATAKVVRASVFENLGIALRRQGDSADALRAYRDAARLAPDAQSLHNDYAKVAAEMGQTGESREAMAVTGIAEAQIVERLIQDATEAQARGERRGLEAALHGVLTLRPGDERAQVALIRTLVQAARLDEALAALEAARTRGLDPEVYAAHQVLIASSRGDAAGAAGWRARLRPGAERDPRVAGTLAMIGSGNVSP